MGINEVIIGSPARLVAPQMVGNGILGHHAALVVGKIKQELVFFTGKVYGGTVARWKFNYSDGPGLGVDPELFQADQVIAGGIPATDNGHYPGAELGQVKGLGEIVVGAQLQAGYLIFERVPG